MKKLIIFICCLFSFISPVYAENFYIQNYGININVDKNKSANITENLDVVFTTPSHGIFRKIPLKKAKITDIDVSDNYTTNMSGSDVIIKIGDAGRLLNGRKHYTIRYKYNYYDNKNEFYHNIIGTGWNTTINHASFNVTMPESVNPNSVGLSIGSYGTAGFNGGAIYSVNKNKIYGFTRRVLNPHEGITLRVEVPDGYFEYAIDYLKYIVIGLMLLLITVAFVIWYIYGKDEPVIPVVNFYPPDNLNPLEMELVYKGKASLKGLIGMLVDLARQGYLKIVSEKQHSLFSKEDWHLEKLKSYKGNNELCERYLRALFRGNTVVSKASLATSTTFYTDCQNIIDSVNKYRNRIFNANSISLPLKGIMFLLLLGIFILTVLCIVNYNLSVIHNNLPVLLFLTIAIIVLITSIVNSRFNLFILLWSVLFAGIPLATIIGDISFESIDISTLVVGIVSLVITGICFYQLPKRNRIGQKLLNDIAGFKNFIEVAEKSRLESLVKENPEYFYKTLPYAYILGVSNKWIKQFEDIAVAKPDWYDGDRFDGHTFNNFADSVHSVSIPSTENGGISTSSSSCGGGGCSGGGGGGGGGGSW